MPATSQAQPLPEPRPARKRRRSREPDWENFYKNGLPKEIIVIEDTPEPQQPNPSSQALTNGHAPAATAATDGANSSSAKKRKRDNEPTPYDPVHHSAVVGSHTPSKSTASDRTNSAVHTTAATSLGSLSSNGLYEHNVQSGQKRKRTTRQQVANEARRRDAGAVTDAFASYKPPPFPPKKARDVHITVISDVSTRRSSLSLPRVGRANAR